MRLGLRSKAPLGVGGLIAVPLYFAGLMASSLALDQPHIVGKKEFQTTSGLEAKIWLAALILPGILVAVGLVATLIGRLGMYLPALAGVVVCLLLPGISQPWVARHTERFPYGIDFVKDSDLANNLVSRGAWEKSAQTTIVSIAHWTLGLCVGVFVVGALVELRRRRGRSEVLYSPTGVDVELDTGGAPPLTG